MSVTLLCLVLWMFEESIYNKISGANSCEDPPVPIPNTEVKLTNAENTWLVTTRENRTVPALRFIFLNLIYSSVAQSVVAPDC